MHIGNLTVLFKSHIAYKQNSSYIIKQKYSKKNNITKNQHYNIIKKQHHNINQLITKQKKYKKYY